MATCEQCGGECRVLNYSLGLCSRCETEGLELVIEGPPEEVGRKFVELTGSKGDWTPVRDDWWRCGEYYAEGANRLWRRSGERAGSSQSSSSD